MVCVGGLADCRYGIGLHRGALPTGIPGERKRSGSFARKTKNALSYQDEKTRYHLISRSAKIHQNAHSISDNGLRR